MLIQSEKTCTKCGQTKPRSDFYKCPPSQKSRDGYRWQCKKCHISNQANKNPELKAKAHQAYYTRHKIERPELYLYKYAKARAKKDGREFTIDLEDINIPELCNIMHRPLSMFDEDWAPSIDRVDSSKGYVKGNIQVISRIANRMKSNATEEQLITFAKGILSIYSKE